MSNTYKVACVFGGTGFIGTQVVRELAKAGYRVKIATRVPERAYDLKPCGAVGQIVPYACRYGDPKSIEEAVKGADVVINLIGVLYEKGASTFQKAHVDIPSSIAQACKTEKIPRFVHVSALGVDENQSKYAKSKMKGEDSVRNIFPGATILRPSVVFGPDDDFFNMFAKLSRLFPVLPLVGGGKTKFQPVFVGDVADAVIAAATLPDVGNKSPLGKIYELGGPEIVTFKEIYETLFAYTKKKRALVPLPYSVAKVQGVAFSLSSKIVGGITGLTPKPLLTADQVESLKTDSIVSDDAYGFEDLGLSATPMESVLPAYLSRFQPGGRFGDKKTA